MLDKAARKMYYFCTQRGGPRLESSIHHSLPSGAGPQLTPGRELLKCDVTLWGVWPRSGHMAALSFLR